MKKLIITLSLVVFLSPILVSAAWWNPFSWGKKSAPIVQQVEVQSSVEDIYVPEPVAQEEITDKVVERIVEKPIIKTQTITVQDPVLQAKIDALVSENNDLKAQISKLLKANATLANQPSVVEEDDSDCTNAKQKLISFNKQLSELTVKYQKDIDTVKSNSGGLFGSALNQEVNKIQEEYYKAQELVYNNIDVSKTEVQLYCK